MTLPFLTAIPAAQQWSQGKIDQIIDRLIDLSVSAGKHILIAIVVYVVGAALVKLINRFVHSMLSRRNIDVSVQSFLRSLVNILLTVLLIVSVIGALGINTTSFAALLASAGVAIGMALSGNLQNFAGGLVILLFKPYRVGDWIEAQGVQGKVKEIQIFHTILTMADNKTIYFPNGSMSTAVVINYTKESMRRVSWSVGIDYGEDVERVRRLLLDLLAADSRILTDEAGKEPFVGLDSLADSSVVLAVRVWVNTENYWPVYHDGQQRIYDMFNREGINFPYPQTTVHISKT